MRRILVENARRKDRRKGRRKRGLDRPTCNLDAAEQIPDSAHGSP
jgi:hypothetical protein